MSVKALWKSILKVTEIGAKPAAGRAPVYVHEIDTPKLEETLTSATTPAVSAVASGAIQLSAGSAILDLTAAPHPSGVDVDLTGLRLRRICIRSRSTNSADVVVTAHGTNGYSIKASETLQAGDSFARSFQGSLSLVSPTAKQISITSADVDAIVDLVILAG